MGHNRLGILPRTRKWRQVVSLIEDGASASTVAAATLDAAEKGLLNAAKDPALIQTFYLLTQLPIAAKSAEYIQTLHDMGIAVSEPSSLLDLVGAFTTAVDSYVQATGERTDIGEMGQLAAAESLTALISEKAHGLFETTSRDIQQAFHDYSTRKQFGTLARDYFSRFIRRYLSYFLSRELSNHVGGEGRFFNTDKHTDFNKALDEHCRQVSRIVEEFAGDWYSKTNYEGEITPEKAYGFLHVAFDKLRGELSRGESAHGE